MNDPFKDLEKFDVVRATDRGTVSWVEKGKLYIIRSVLRSSSGTHVDIQNLGTYCATQSGGLGHFSKAQFKKVGVYSGKIAADQDTNPIKVVYDTILQVRDVLKVISNSSGSKSWLLPGAHWVVATNNDPHEYTVWDMKQQHARHPIALLTKDLDTVVVEWERVGTYEGFLSADQLWTGTIRPLIPMALAEYVQAQRGGGKKQEVIVEPLESLSYLERQGSCSCGAEQCSGPHSFFHRGGG